MSILLGDNFARVQVAKLRVQTGMIGSWWHAPNGTVWPLHDIKSGVVLTPGVEGLYMPKYDTYTSKTMLPGARHRGSRAQSREIMWPLLISSRLTSRLWMELDSAFWAGIDPDEWGWWEWRARSGSSRFLRVQFLEEMTSPDKDPTVSGWGVYAIKMVAHQPFWEGADERTTFENVQPHNFLPTAERPYPYISSSADTKTAGVQNVGTEPAWPVWKVEGPASNVVVGIGDQLTWVPFALGPGEWVEIDTRQWGPRGFGAVDWLGRDRTQALSAFTPAAIPPGERTPVSVSFDGAGSVQVTIAPLYKRAW